MTYLGDGDVLVLRLGLGDVLVLGVSRGHRLGHVVRHVLGLSDVLVVDLWGAGVGGGVREAGLADPGGDSFCVRGKHRYRR